MSQLINKLNDLAKKLRYLDNYENQQLDYCLEKLEGMVDDALSFVEKTDYLEKLAEECCSSSIDFEKEGELLKVFCGNECVAKCRFRSGYVVNNRVHTNISEAMNEIKKIVNDYPY